MSRIGKKPILVPKGVDIKIDSDTIAVKGPKGSLERSIHRLIKIERDGDNLNVLPKGKSRDNNKFQGLTRSLVANMVEGVTAGFSKSLQLVGVGYRATQKGSDVEFALGYSHPILFKPLEGITLKVEKPTSVVVSGVSKENVGETAAKIRSLRPPEPYHGKGVRYEGEHIKTKVGKAAGK